MGADLPPGKWTLPLIGPWWPGPPTALRSAAEYWKRACIEQEQYSQGLRNQRTALTAHNQGRTADDLSARYYKGEQFHLDLAEKYQNKAAALNACADQIDTLRSRLAQLAADGNQEIDRILASKQPEPAKLLEVHAVQDICNAKAEVASDTAVTNMFAATQPMLANEGIHSDTRTWAREHGFGVEQVPRPRPISEQDLNPAVGLAGGPGGDQPRANGVFGGGAQGPAPALTGTTGGPGGGGNAGGHPGAGLQGRPPASTGLAGGPGNSGVGSGVLSRGGETTPTMSSNLQFQGAGGSTMPGVPTVHGAPMSPAAGIGQNPSPGLGQSFASGVATGQTAGAGPQSLSTNAMNAMEAGTPPPAQTATPTSPPVAPSVPAGGAFIPAHAPVDAAPATSDAPPAASGGTTSVAPAVVTGGAWTAPPPTSGPAVPAGPLPAYGSDLRPPASTPPTMPAAPAGPVSGAPVAPSASSSPSAGGPLVSPVERSAQGAAAGHSGTGSSTLGNASAVSAATGATAGAASTRSAEQQRLQRLVNAVARQEPRLAWAAGLRDDGTTTLLVTDLAGGWIPPHVRLPAHVTLLEPTARRRDASVIDLLGAVSVAAAHHANTYVAEPGNEEPALTGDRLARSAVRQVDELGPTLVEAVRRRDGLPRIAQAVAAPAVRKTGVLENEIQLLRDCIADVQASTLNAYPLHDLTAVGDWMLLAAIEALIAEHEYLANYHMAWFDVITA